VNLVSCLLLPFNYKVLSPGGCHIPATQENREFEASLDNTARPPSKKQTNMLSVVVQICNPTYSGGRDQKDHGSRPSMAKCSRDPHLS
jgi:hypothetical protein